MQMVLKWKQKQHLHWGLTAKDGITEDEDVLETPGRIQQQHPMVLQVCPMQKLAC